VRKRIALYAVVEESGALHEGEYGILAFTNRGALEAWEGRPARRIVEIVSEYDEPGPTPEYVKQEAQRAARLAAQKMTSREKYIKRRKAKPR
jgi:hypothetical protein